MLPQIVRVKSVQQESE